MWDSHPSRHLLQHLRHSTIEGNSGNQQQDFLWKFTFIPSSLKSLYSCLVKIVYMVAAGGNARSGQQTLQSISREVWQLVSLLPCRKEAGALALSHEKQPRREASMPKSWMCLGQALEESCAQKTLSRKAALSSVYSKCQCIPMFTTINWDLSVSASAGDGL